MHTSQAVHLNARYPEGEEVTVSARSHGSTHWINLDKLGSEVTLFFGSLDNAIQVARIFRKELGLPLEPEDWIFDHTPKEESLP